MSIDKLNEAIKTIKAVCEDNNICTAETIMPKPEPYKKEGEE